MARHIYTIEELMLDDSFISYCLATGSAVPSQWRKIIRDNPHQQQTFEEAKKLVHALHGGLSRMEVNRQIEIVKKQLKERSGSPDVSKQETDAPLYSDFVVTGEGQIKRKLLKRIFAGVTAACLILVAGWSFYQKEGSASADQSAVAQQMNYQSPLGQRQKVFLPDGTEVILNSNSQLFIDKDYNQKSREVHLKGNAFFKVAKDTKRPFLVYAGSITTKALGTEFYVHGNNDKEKGIRIELLEGKVLMTDNSKHDPGNSLILYPGEAGSQAKGLGLQKSLFDSLQLNAWLGGRISFNETPVIKALEQLETWYGTKIKVNRSGLKNRYINGDYQDAALQDILKVICFTLNRKYSFVDNTVIIE